MRVRLFLALILIVLATACVASSQSPIPIRGPMLGYVWDPEAAGLRAILGIPGASSLGSVLDAGAALRAAAVAPRQDYALGMAAESGKMILLDLRADSPSVRPLEVDGAPDRVLFSPTGAAAALYYSDRPAVRVLTGLPQAAALGTEFDLSNLPSPITAIAVSDDGGIVLAAAPGNVYALGRNRAPVPAAVAANASALSFLENSQDAILADYDRNEIVLIRDVTGAAERILLAGENDGIERPMAVAAAGRRIAAASASRIAVLELDGSPPALLSCPCRVSGLHPLGGTAVFRLNAPSADPMFLLDAGASPPQVLFIPAAPAAGRGRTPAASFGLPVPRGRARP